MKILGITVYNPFSPHLVEWCDGSFGARSMTIFGWQYFSKNGVGHTNREGMIKYCEHLSLEEAEELIKKLRVCVRKKHL